MAQDASDRIKELIIESETEIEQAIQDAFELAQDKEMETGNPQVVKVSFNHKIAVDFSNNEQVDTLAFNRPFKLELRTTVKDPNQPELI